MEGKPLVLPRRTRRRVTRPREPRRGKLRRRSIGCGDAEMNLERGMYLCVEAAPPVGAEMAIIHGRDITLCRSPVPRNGGGDGVDCQLGDAMSEGSLVRKPDTGAADPPNGAEGGDAEEVTVTKEGSVGRFLRPMERIVGKEDTW